MRLYKRIASIVLCFAMLLVYAPTTVLAAEAVSYVDYTWNEEEQKLTSEDKTVTEYTVVGETTTTMSTGWYVVSGEVTVSERIAVEGTVHLILTDGAHLTAREGISVNEENKLYIYARSSDEGAMGKLTATTTDYYNAVIGSDEYNYAGTIVINGGNVNVTASYNGAGIGSARGRSGYDITINAGKVTATASFGSAAIGSGNCGTTSTEGRLGDTRSIAIHGGAVEATVTESYGAAIGGGSYFDGGDITITGGSVKAVSGESGAAIGGGKDGNGGNITITGGTVTATYNNTIYAVAAIGSGYRGEDAGNILITGGNVNATSQMGSGIGAGYDTTTGSITILGGEVTATGTGSQYSNISAGEDGSMMLLDGNTVNVTGNHTLSVDYTLSEETILNISQDASLTIPENVTLTLSEDATIINNGTLTNYGTINCYTHVGGTPTCTTPDTCTICGESYYKNHTSGNYSASGNILTDSCTICGTELGKAAIEAEDSTYNTFPHIATVTTTGTFASADFTIQYIKEGETTSSAIAPTNAGTYTAKIEYNGVMIETEFTIAKAEPKADMFTFTAPSSLTYDGTCKDAIVTVKNGITGMGEVIILYYTTSNGITYEKQPIGAGNYTVQIRVLEGSNYAAAIEDNLTNDDWTFTIIDEMAPIGEITIGTNSWTTFLDTITFGLFFNDTVDVTITANGTGSSVAKVEYLLSTEDLSNSSMPADGWTTLTAESGKYNFSIDPRYKGAVYARITDEAGNVAVINSDGIVVYEDCVITPNAVDYVYKSNANCVVQITENENTFAYLTDAEGTTIEAENYTVEDGKLTLKADYLRTLKTGEYTYKIYMNPLSVTGKTVEYTFTVNVKPSPLTIVEVEATDRVYDGTKQVTITNLTLSGIKDTDDVKVSFSGLTGTLSSANAGTYTAVTIDDLALLDILTGNDAANYEVEYVSGTEIPTEVTISKAVATVTKAPTANALIFNAKAQALVSVGTTNDGTFMYSLSENGEYTASIPTATEIGDYTVWYYVKGDANHADSAKASVKVTIAEGPHIENEEGKMGWDAILDEVEDVLTSEEENTVVVDMNGQSVVPADVLEEIKGKDIEVKFDLGDGIVWTVNGADITGTTLEDIDFAVTVNTDEKPNTNIPVEVINKVTGENTHVEISLAHDGEFGFTAVLSLNLDAENAGLFANLYYYNPTKQAMEFICADEIAADGTTDLTFTHASDYTIVIDEEPANAEKPDVPQTGDSTDITLWAMLLMAGLGLVAFGQKRRTR